LTIIKSKIKCLHKGVADFEACLDNFCEDPARSCENLIFFFCPNKTILLTKKPARQLKLF